MALPGYPGKKRYGYHPPGRRRKSGKLLRRALYQTVYSWTPFEPELWKAIDPIIKFKTWQKNTQFIKD